jgi:DNA-binding CsgD family transcriptional regulator
LPIPVLLLDRLGAVLVCNRLARALLEPAHPLTVDAAGRLQISDANEAARFRRLLRAPRGLSDAGLMSVSRAAGQAPLTVLVAQLGPHIAHRSADDEPAIAVFVTDPGARPNVNHTVLGELYGLTSAEARLAAVLLEANGIAAAAGELGISVNTARTHLKRVFCKTGTRRQAELVRLLLCGPAALLGQVRGVHRPHPFG